MNGEVNASQTLKTITMLKKVGEDSLGFPVLSTPHKNA